MTQQETQPLRTTSPDRLRHLLVRPWTCAGITLGVLSFVDPQPFTPFTLLTGVLPLVALAYLVYALLRSWRPAATTGGGARPVTRQAVGVVLFAGIALVTVAVDPTIGQYVLAAGWLGHAFWDYAHRDGRVVPRGFVDFCLPFDVLVAASIVVAALT
ncbi:hypothetical protein ACI2K4_05170 [Micromonospora sp. NPDC050397]|uniref:hypothetical protein n=1 Tax=Micromonospora sp. NPDC050397 TaxID=3364279 RepID=UPI00385129ED